MICPRCGEPNEDGATHCGACGQRLPEPDPPEQGGEPSSRGGGMGRLLGRTRRERVITAVTAIVLVAGIAVAIVALTGGGASESEEAEAAYIERIDQLCVDAKQQLTEAAARASRFGSEYPALRLYGQRTSDIVQEWRRRLRAQYPPPRELEARAQIDRGLVNLDRTLQSLGGEGGYVAYVAKFHEPVNETPRELRARLTRAGGFTEQELRALGLDACAQGGLGMAEFQSG